MTERTDGPGSAFSRRRFLVASMAAVGFTLAPRFWGGAADAFAASRYSPTIWYTIDEAGIVTVHVAKAEMGQHIGTAFAMAIAEELEADWRDILLDYPDASQTYGIMVTGGSWSVTLNFDDMLRAGALGRTALIEAGAKILRLPLSECRAARGRVLHDRTGGEISYAELVRTGAVDRVFGEEDFGNVPLKPVSAYRIIGQSVLALDIPAKVSGEARYGIDMFVPDMLYAKIARPPVRAGAKPLTVDDAEAKKIASYRRYVMADDPMKETSAYVIALADTYPAALAAAQALKIEWELGPYAKTGDADILARARELVADPKQGLAWWLVGDAGMALAEAPSHFEAEYTTALVAHVQIEPMNALVFRIGDIWHAYVGSQFQTKAVAVLANVLDVDSDQIALHQTYLGGGFGRRTETDMLVAAALAAKASGRPVKLIFDREEDLRFDFHRSITFQKLEVGLDARNRSVALRHHVCSGWPLKRALSIALQQSADKKGKLDFSALNGADSWYSFPNYHVRAIENDLAQAATPPGILRSVSTGYVFWALESFIDELAHRLGKDPVALRLELLDAGGINAGGPPSAIGGATRLADVIRRLVEISGYEQKKAQSLPGHGIGIAAVSAPDRNQPSWTACLAELFVDRKTGAVRLEKLTVVGDVGLAVNPDGVRAQMEGALLWGVSVALHEQANLRDGRIEQTNFDTYRPLRMADVPELEIHILDTGHHPTGTGEPVMSAVAPAIANAIFHAVGARVRSLPITPEKVLAALEELRPGGNEK